jgi:hypothetical protein
MRLRRGSGVKVKGMKRREGKPKGKGGRRENTIDFRRIVYSQLPRYIVFDLGDE